MIVNGKVSQLQITRANNPALDKLAFQHPIAAPTRHVVLAILRKVEFAGDELDSSVGIAHARKNDRAMLVRIAGKKVSEKLSFHLRQDYEPPWGY
jgi:hypothetical protein